MLYPKFNDLVALRNKKSLFKQPSSRLLKSAIAGNHSSPFRGQGLEFDAVREYVLGDDIRSIDWRVTARTGAPHIKIFKEEKERQIIIAVDMNEEMRFGTKNTFKSVQAAYIASILSWEAIATQDRMRLCFFGDVKNGLYLTEAKRTKQSVCQMLKTLTEPPQENHHVCLNQAFTSIYQTAPAGATVYVISDFLRIENLEKALGLLVRKCDVVFIAVNDPADQMIPPIGHIGCFHQEQKIFINTDLQAARKVWAEQWEKNRQLLNSIVSKWNIPLIEMSTETDIRKDFIGAMKRRGEKRCRSTT